MPGLNINISGALTDFAGLLTTMRDAGVEYAETGALSYYTEVALSTAIGAAVADFLPIAKDINAEFPGLGLLGATASLQSDMNAYSSSTGGNSTENLGHLLQIVGDWVQLIGNVLSIVAQPEFGVPTALGGSIMHEIGTILLNSQKKPQAPTKPTQSDPLVLDLIGAGIKLTDLSGSPAYFDYTGTGVRTETGWVAPGEGLLVMNPVDGQTVTSQSLLGALSGNGFSDLAALDSNSDGFINSDDTSYSQLRVWVNTSGTGQSSAGELFTLAQLGITSIGVNSFTSGQLVDGNTVVATATFTRELNGISSTNTIAEVNFQTTTQIPSGAGAGVTVSEDAQKLPDLVGFGFMPDLRNAMSEDATLEQMVYNLVMNSANVTSSQFSAAFQDILYEWAGAESVSSTAYGSFIDGQHMAVIYAYFGIDPNTDPQYMGWEPNWHNGPSVWEPTYQKILQFYELAFTTQIYQSLVDNGVDASTAISNPYALFSLVGYDSNSNELTSSTDALASTIAGMIANIGLDSIASTATWQQILTIVNAPFIWGSGTAPDGYQKDGSGKSVVQTIIGDLLTQNAFNLTQLQTVASLFSESSGFIVNGESAGALAVQETYDSIISLAAGDNIVAENGGNILIAGANVASVNFVQPASYFYGMLDAPVGATAGYDGVVIERDSSVSIQGYSHLNSSVDSDGVAPFTDTLVINFSDGTSLALQSFFDPTDGTTAGYLVFNGNEINILDIDDSLFASEMGTLGFTQPWGGRVTANSENQVLYGSETQTLAGKEWLASGLPSWYTEGYGSGATFVAGPDDVTMVAGAGSNTYDVNLGDGNVNVIGESYESSSGVLVLGNGIDSSMLSITRVASLGGTFNGMAHTGGNSALPFGSVADEANDKLSFNLPDLLISIAGTDQTIRLSNEDQSLYALTASNGVGVGQIRFSDGTVWSLDDILSRVDTSVVSAAATSLYPNVLLSQGSYGDDVLQARPGSVVLAGGYGNDTYVVSSGDNSVIVNDSLGGLSGGGSDVNLLEFGAGVSKGDIVVSQAENGEDIVLTDLVDGLTVTLAHQLDGQAGSIISEVRFADGTSWSNADMYAASVNTAVAESQKAIFGSTTLTDTYGFVDLPGVYNDLPWNLWPTQFVWLSPFQFSTAAIYQFGADDSRVDAQVDEAYYIYDGNSNYTIDFTNSTSDSASVFIGSYSRNPNFDFWGFADMKSSYSADGNSIVLTASGYGGSITLENIVPLGGIQSVFNVYVLDRTGSWGWDDFLTPQYQTAESGDTTITVTHNYLTVDTNGFADRVNSSGDGETFIYGRGYGAVTIDEEDTASSPNNTLKLEYLSISDEAGFQNYTIDEDGDLSIDFGSGDVLTILHEYNADGTVSADGIQLGGNLGALALEQREFNAVSGQSGLVGDGLGGVFDPKGYANSVSDSGSNVDTILYNRGYGTLTIGELSNNGNNTLEFGAGISFQDLSFSLDGSGGIIISLGSGDQVDIVNAVGLVQPLNGGYGVANLLFADGSTAWFNKSWNWSDNAWSLGVTAQSDDGSSISLDTSSLLQSTLTSPAGPATFTAEGAVQNIVGTGGADQINYEKGDGALTVSELSTNGPATSVLNVNAYGLIFSDDIWAQGSGPALAFAMDDTTSGGGDDAYGGGDDSYGGGDDSYGSSSSVPELGGMIGVTANDAGDVTLYFGDGDRVTLLGQLSDSSGASGVSQIVATDAWGWIDTWTNADLQNALAYEAETGVVPDGLSADGGGSAPISNVVMMAAAVPTSSAAGTAVSGSASTLSGGDTSSTLDGSAGNMTIAAGSAGDTLVGGNGDTLIGGSGSDTFVFHAGFGQETVTGFMPSGPTADVLQFDTNVFSDWAHLLGATVQQGSDLLITLDASDSILVKNMAISSFSSANAHFV
ncbi:beta strand repeat-containing protein [Novosphingobium terrae]|uniref:beta strand repeat-containing protein n=1 Tax=Novosphingobium terrae TaxID=2726189 RepID=UPI00197FC692|nr:calcium-binding protein [Novosphingobium terrae]